MKLSELAYNIWSDSATTTIEKDIEGLIDSQGLPKDTETRMINRIFDVGDNYDEDSIDWIERVVEVIDSYEDK